MTETAILISSQDGETSKFEYALEGHLNKVQSTLYSQWIEGDFCDVQLHTIDGCIYAHACLLAAFSPKIAAILNTSGCDLNAERASGAICLEIMFKHSIVKVILEAIYSGCFTAALEQINELLAALQWLDMHELAEIVKSIQNKAEKENRTTHSELQPSDIPSDVPSIKTGRRKSLRRPNRSTYFTKDVIGNSGPNSVQVVVSLVNNVPVVLSGKHKDKETLQLGLRKNCEGLVLEGRAEESVNLSLPKEEPLQVPDVDIDNINLNCNDHHVDSHENIPRPENNIYHSFEVDLPTLEEASAEERSKDRNRKIRKKSRQKDKGIQKRKSSKVEKLMKSKPEGSKRKRRTPHHVVQTPSVETDGNIGEGEKEKEKHATEALISIGDTLIKEEPPELEECEPDESQEIEQAFLEGQIQYIKCYKCRSSFSSVEEYKNHVENHPTFTCENCYTVFYSSSNLCRHFRKEHLKSMHLKCSHCEFTDTDDKKFGKHCVEVHQELRPFKCLFEGCKFTTTKYRYLANHFGNHDQISTWECGKCQKRFHNRALWYSHERSCFQLRNYLCDICGQNFNHSTSMQIHRRTMHLRERPCKCEVCHKCFSNAANLRRHMRIHNNTFPYSCTVCGKKFRHSNTLKLHISKHKEIMESNPAVLQPSLDSVFPPEKSSDLQERPIYASNATIQLCSIPSFPPSTLPSMLSTIQPTAVISQALSVTQPVVTVNSSIQSFPATVSGSHDPNTNFLQYDGHIDWHDSGSYPLPNL